MKNRLFVLSALVVALGSVQSACGMDAQQLLTLENTRIVEKYTGIAQEDAFVACPHQYEGMAVTEKPQNIFKAILVKKQQDGDVVGLVAQMKQRESEDPLFKYYPVNAFFRKKYSHGGRELIATDKVENGLMFNLHPAEGGTACCVQIVDAFGVDATVAAGAIDFTQLKTLKGGSVIAICPGIKQKGAFTINDEQRYKGYLTFVEPTNVVEAIIIRTKTNDLALICKKPQRNSVTKPSYKLDLVENFYSADGKNLGVVNVTVGSIFFLKTTEGAIAEFVKIVDSFAANTDSVDAVFPDIISTPTSKDQILSDPDGDKSQANSYLMKATILGAVGVIGIAVLLWWKFPDFFSKFFTRA